MRPLTLDVGEESRNGFPHGLSVGGWLSGLKQFRPDLMVGWLRLAVFPPNDGICPRRFRNSCIGGVNCGSALDLDDVSLCKEVTAATGDAHVIIQPNAGGCRSTATPEHLAAIASSVAARG
jgi:hypothetical protein